MNCSLRSHWKNWRYRRNPREFFYFIFERVGRAKRKRVVLALFLFRSPFLFTFFSCATFAAAAAKSRLSAKRGETFSGHLRVAWSRQGQCSVLNGVVTWLSGPRVMDRCRTFGALAKKNRQVVRVRCAYGGGCEEFIVDKRLFCFRNILFL